MGVGGDRRRRDTSRMDFIKGSDVEGRLRGELRRLQRLYGLGSGLEEARWLPREDGDLSGEVRGGTVYIYEPEPSRALETLRHEVLDHHLTAEVLEPLVGLINLQKSAIEKMVYKRKEELIEKLSRML
ncbi:MAG: hypothetical protein QW639_05465 [Candidatus Bathyarchaeia archaeon]